MITLDEQTSVERAFELWFASLPVDKQNHSLRLTQSDVHRLKRSVDRAVFRDKWIQRARSFIAAYTEIFG